MKNRILLIALGTFLTVSAYADTCIWKGLVEARSTNGRFIVRLDRARPWKGRVEDSSLETVTEANLPGLEPHAHFDALITDDGERVIVFEPSVDDRPSANLFVYDGDLRLLRSFKLDELLSENDMGAVWRSISHCEFTRVDPAKKRRFGLEDDGKTFAIHLRSGRTALVSLAEPKIIPTPDVVPEVFEFEEGLPPGKTDRERFQGRWMITEGRSGIMVVRSNSFTDNPQYYMFTRDRVLTPGRCFDKYTFRLDESVTPHAIDLFGPGEKEPVRGIYEFRGGKLLICVPVRPEKLRPSVIDAKESGLDYWTETLQRRKPRAG